MTDAHHILRNLVARRERIDDEIADLQADRRALMREVEAEGFDRKAFAEVIRRRRMDPRLRAELDEMVGIYEGAVGDQPRGALDGGELSASAALPAPDGAGPAPRIGKAAAETRAWLEGGVG